MTAEIAQVAGIRGHGIALGEDLRGIEVVWEREMIRFLRNRIRIATSLAQTLIFLFVLGTGLSPVVPSSPGQNVDYRTFMFPGILAMTVLFTSISSGISIVQDREFGFLREILVAPVSRWAVVTGKCLGGASVAAAQGTIMLALAGLVHVPYQPVLLLTLILEMALAAFTLTAIGILVASRIQQIQSYEVIVQFLVLPMFFLSGALFPLSRLPAWLSTLTKIDPLTYVVDPMRHAVFAHVTASAELQATLNPGLDWGGWRLPIEFELALVAVLGVALLGIAVLQFSKPED